MVREQLNGGAAVDATPLDVILQGMQANLRRAEVGTLDSRTLRLRVGDEHAGYDLYVILGWAQRRFVHIDVTLSLSAYNSVDFGKVEKLEVVNLRREQISLARATMEVITRQATLLLAAGIWTLEDVIEAWAGTHVYHGGACHTLPVVDGVVQQATGALDAVARLLRARLPALKQLKEQTFERVSGI